MQNRRSQLADMLSRAEGQQQQVYCYLIISQFIFSLKDDQIYPKKIISNKIQIS